MVVYLCKKLDLTTCKYLNRQINRTQDNNKTATETDTKQCKFIS